MSRNLSVETHLNLIKDSLRSYHEDSDGEYFFEVNFRYPEMLHELHNNLPFLPDRMKIEKVEKLVANWLDKKTCFSHKKFKTNIKLRVNFEKRQ